MGRGSSASGSGRTALGGVLAAGSLVLLWMACLLPSGRMGLTAAAGLFPVAGVLVAGRAAGYLCWAAASLIGLILLPDKGISALYLLFLGLYPVVKSRIEALRSQPAEWCCKLAFFNAALTLFWIFLRGLLLPNLPDGLENHSAIVYLLGNVIFVAYDIGLSKLIALLRRRLRLD